LLRHSTRWQVTTNCLPISSTTHATEIDPCKQRDDRNKPVEDYLVDVDMLLHH